MMEDYVNEELDDSNQTVVVKQQAEEVGKRAPDKLRAQENTSSRHARN